MIVTVTPNPAVDRTLTFDTVRPGAVNRARSVSVEPSGKGVNVARALTRNGVTARAVLPLGGAEGRQLAELLDAEGVAYAAIPVRGAVRVNISVVTADGEATKLNEPGARLTPAEERALEDVAARAAAGASWVVGSGAPAPGMSPDFYARLVTRARVGGARVALDTSGPALRAGLAAEPDLVKPNAEELADLTGRPVRTLADVVAAARAVRAKTSGTVVVSLGRDGAVVVDAAGVTHGEVVVADVRSAVGAGDNLLAGYLGALEAGADHGAEALREALAWAGVAVGSTGSVGRPVTEVDRVAVRVSAELDLGRRLAG